MDAGPSSNPLERRRMPYSATGSSAAQKETVTRPEAFSGPQAKQAEDEKIKDRANRKKRRYGPRTCRICFDTEQPKFPSGMSTTFGISTTSSRPVYESDDAELGRLLSPCKCKGSAKYVHEGCLSAWRLTNPTATGNFWQCPTCKYTYRMARLHWATRLSSQPVQITLTAMVIILCLFILGFIADPILDVWFDPVGSIADTVSSVVSDIDARQPFEYEDEPTSWTDHFTKGFFSLGLIGAIKSFLAVGPWHWLNLRAGGIFGSGRRGGTGRNRAENFNLLFVAIGAFTFMMAVWKFVKAMSARILARVSHKVMDIGVDDDDDGNDGDDDGDDDGNADEEDSSVPKTADEGNRTNG